MTLIEQLKSTRANLEVEYAAKRSLLDTIIHRAETQTGTTEAELVRMAPKADAVTAPVEIPPPAAAKGHRKPAAKVNRQPKHPAVPGRRPGIGTVAAAVRELLPGLPNHKFTGAEVCAVVLAKYPTLSNERDFTTKVAGALFNLREKNEIEIVRRVGNSPIYRLLKLRDTAGDLRDQIRREVEEKKAKLRAVEDAA